jgi:hypothetical protein
VGAQAVAEKITSLMTLFDSRPFIKNEASTSTRKRNLLLRIALEASAVVVFFAALGFTVWIMVDFFVGFFVVILFMVVTPHFLTWVVGIRRLGLRYSVLSAETQIEKDKRAPILYLRSFLDDYTSNDSRSDQRTDEELLTMILKKSGPVVAVGIPGERLPPLGAARMYLGDNWESIVQGLMVKAQLIVVSPGLSEGLITEMSFVRSLKCTQKMILPLMSLSDMMYGQFCESFEEVFGVLPPQRERKALFLYFKDSETPEIIYANDRLYKLYAGRAGTLLGDGTLFILREALRVTPACKNLVLKKSGLVKVVLTSLLIRIAVFGLLLAYTLGLLKILHVVKFE